MLSEVIKCISIRSPYSKQKNCCVCKQSWNISIRLASPASCICIIQYKVRSCFTADLRSFDLIPQRHSLYGPRMAITNKHAADVSQYHNNFILACTSNVIVEFCIRNSYELQIQHAHSFYATIDRAININR